jgi:hypothetical protein
MSHLLSYYYDAHATKKLPTDNLGNYKVAFFDPSQKIAVAGISSVYATIYVRNDNFYPMELIPKTIVPDLRVTEWPEFLEPNEVGKVVLAFSPSADRTVPLEGGSWDFDLVVYPNVR